MKKRDKIILIVIASIVLLGTVLGIVDYNRIKSGEMPLFMVRITHGSKSRHHYIGLGYKLKRIVGVSFKQPLYADDEVKFGLWFYSWKIKITNNLDYNLISPNNDIQKVTSKEVKSIQKGMIYKEIITKLGATKNEGFGVYSATYLVDNEDLLYISFSNINDICDKSGEEFLEQMIKTTLIDKAYSYLDNEIKSKIIKLYESTVTTLNIENNSYFYLDKNSEMKELKNKEIILVDFEKNSSTSATNNIIVILDAKTKEVLGLGLID